MKLLGLPPRCADDEPLMNLRGRLQKKPIVMLGLAKDEKIRLKKAEAVAKREVIVLDECDDDDEDAKMTTGNGDANDITSMKNVRDAARAAAQKAASKTSSGQEGAGWRGQPLGNLWQPPSSSSMSSSSSSSFSSSSSRLNPAGYAAMLRQQTGRHSSAPDAQDFNQNLIARMPRASDFRASSAFNMFDHGDSAIFPSSAAASLTHAAATASGVLTLQVKKRESKASAIIVIDEEDEEDEEGDGSDESVYVRAREFSAPNGVLILPPHIFRRLVGESSPLQQCNVNVQLVKGGLPRAAFLQLQPHEAAWLDLDQETRMAVLHFHLRRYHACCKGDVISLQHATGRLFHFSVLQAVAEMEDGAARAGRGAAPTTAVRLTDSDVACDVVEPLEPLPELPKQITVGHDPITCKLSRGGSNGRFWFLVNEDPHPSYEIVVETASAGIDPDLYCSHGSVTRNPSPCDHQFASDETVGPSATLQVPSDCPPGTYYLLLNLFSNEDDQRGSEVSVSIQMRDTTAVVAVSSSSSTTSSSTTLSGSGSACSNCGRVVPTNSFVMHEAQCRRLTFRCDQCGLVAPRASEKKHQALSHTAIDCDYGCGAEFERAEWQLHREYDCPNRPAKCLYCSLVLPVCERGEHQGQCGSRSAECNMCHSRFRVNEMKRHYQRTHGKNEVSHKDWT